MSNKKSKGIGTLLKSSFSLKDLVLGRSLRSSTGGPSVFRPSDGPRHPLRPATLAIPIFNRDTCGPHIARTRIPAESRGITLIESVLTIGILSAGLIGVLYVFSAGTKSSLVADQTTIASNLAREKLEQIAADRANNGYAATIAANYSDGQLTGAYSEFTRTVTIAEVDPDDDNATDDFLDALVGSGYARVTVTVSFTGASSVVLETLIANYP